MTETTLRARRAAGSYGLMDKPREPHDLYETPAEAVDMLCRYELPMGGVWEPSAGRGAIVRRLRERSPDRHIVASDIGVYQPEAGGMCLHRDLAVMPGIDHMFCADFLTVDARPLHTRFIVMNPPFRQSEAHVRHAISLLPKDDYYARVFALLRFNWIAARRRADLIPHLGHILICGRLKMLPPDVPDQGHGGTVDFAWFVFNHHNRIMTRITRA